ncbi:MAG: DUF1573 domain-containing protein [Candidatus Cryptobacteroides sp.]
MKKGLLSIVAALSVCLSAGAQSLYFPNSVQEGGSIKEGDPVQSFIYEFENVSPAPVKIIALRTNCSCTSASSSAEIIQPGEKGTVTLRYSPEGRSGSFDTKVYVYTDRSTEPENTLSLRIRVVDDSPYPYRMGPYALQTKEVVFQAGKKAKAEILYRKLSQDAAPLSLRSDFLCPELKANVKKDRIIVEYRPKGKKSTGEYPLFIESKEKQTKVIIKIK